MKTTKTKMLTRLFGFDFFLCLLRKLVKYGPKVAPWLGTAEALVADTSTGKW